MTLKNNVVAVSGWLVIDKPIGMTSAAVVGKVKRLLKCKKVGHAGTLDPLASGVLPLALGEATKVVSYATNDEKSYSFTVQWGVATETDDCEGAVIATSAVRPKKEAVLAILPEFMGDIMQVPPHYSAIKVNGKRAYNLARQGKSFELEARCVQIKSLTLTDITEDSATFHVCCGKGTYVRSLARDIAQRLNTQGHVTMLVREHVGVFSKKNAILLEKLEETVYKNDALDGLMPLEVVLDDIPVLLLNSEEARAIRHGQTLPFSGSQDAEKLVLMCDNVPVAIAVIDEKRVKPTRVFNL